MPLLGWRSLIGVVVVAVLGTLALLLLPALGGSPGAAAAAAGASSIPISTRQGAPVTDESAGGPFLVAALVGLAVVASFFAVMLLVTRMRERRQS